MTPAQVRVFRKKIYGYFEEHGRDLPWRKTRNPYHILLSEIMLQQTQVERVLIKYPEFLKAFPGFAGLAASRLPELLRIWSGMGYNRRALALRTLAQIVMNDHGGRLPADVDRLLALPGIGKYTAGAVLAFAFNKPVVFMDTNIRRVFIHEFFGGRSEIHDHELLPVVQKTLDTENPRKWYNALMDYGSMLRSTVVNPNRRSVHHSRQDPFENSNRQIRGKILRLLVGESCLTAAQITARANMDHERVKSNLALLEKEGFIKKKGRMFFVP